MCSVCWLLIQLLAIFAPVAVVDYLYYIAVVAALVMLELNLMGIESELNRNFC